MSAVRAQRASIGGARHYLIYRPSLGTSSPVKTSRAEGLAHALGFGNDVSQGRQASRAAQRWDEREGASSGTSSVHSYTM